MTRRRPARRRDGGMSLVELAIACGLLATVLGLTAVGTTRALGTRSGTVGKIELERKAAYALERVLTRIEDCGLSSIAESLTTSSGSSTLTFRRPVGWSSGAIVYGPQMVVSLVADPNDPINGTDDDKDGVTDQRVLQLQVGTSTPVVLSRNVRPLLAGETTNSADENGNGLVDESGFCASADGESVTLRLTLARKGADGQLYTVTVSRTTRVGP